MLLYAHVAHLHPGNEFVDGETFSPLNGVEYFKPLGAADFGE